MGNRYGQRTLVEPPVDLAAPAGIHHVDGPIEYISGGMGGLCPAVVRVLIADALPVVREGLESLLEAIPAVDPVGTATDGEETLRAILTLGPDVVLLDTALGGEPATLIRRMKDAYPDVAVLLFSGQVLEGQVERAVAAGANGAISKTAPVPHLLFALREVADGGFVVDPHLTDRRCSTAPPVLSDRELDVLHLIVDGLSNKEIGDKLFIALPTVKRHVEHIAKKLGRSHRAALVCEAFRRGMVG